MCVSMGGSDAHQALDLLCAVIFLKATSLSCSLLLRPAGPTPGQAVPWLPNVKPKQPLPCGCQRQRHPYDSELVGMDTF